MVGGDIDVDGQVVHDGVQNEKNDVESHENWSFHRQYSNNLIVDRKTVKVTVVHFFAKEPPKAVIFDIFITVNSELVGLSLF